MNGENVPDKIQFQTQGIKFLYEMEILDDPQLINNLKLNILMTSPRIRDLEILSLHRHGRKEMLIWLDLSWWGARFGTAQILSEAGEMAGNLLPNFQLRITSDREILNAAVRNVKAFFAPNKTQLGKK